MHTYPNGRPLVKPRYRYGGIGQLRTNGLDWTISAYKVENGQMSGLESEYFCQNRLGSRKQISDLFTGRSMSYIDNSGKLVVRDCYKTVAAAPAGASLSEKAK